MLTPAYKLIAYKHRRVDATETQPLTPVAGAAHSDPFQVTTLPALAGFKPFLDSIRGRRTSIDPLDKTTDTGEMVFRLLDKRTGTSNLSRWVTAFLGNTDGREQLKGCKVVVWESLDGGVTWSSFFVGRIQRIGLGSKLWFDLTVRDMAQDLQSEVFSGPAHGSVTYARSANLLPSDGLAAAFGGMSAVRPLTGKIATASFLQFTTQAGKAFIELDDVYWERRVNTKALREASTSAPRGSVRVRIKRLDNGTEGDLQLDNPFNPGEQGFGGSLFINTLKKEWGFIEKVGVSALPTTDPRYIALPPVGTRVEFHVSGGVKPSKNVPLLMDDVDPVALIQDLCAGKFSPLAADGSPRRIVAVNAAAANALLGKLPKLRFVIDGTRKLAEFIEEAICKPLHIAYTLNADGELVLIDLRLKNVGIPGVTIGQGDLASDRDASWEMSQDTTVTRVEFTHYMDSVGKPTEKDSKPEFSGRYPDTVPCTLDSQDLLYIGADLREEGFGVQPRTFRIDAIGFRSAEGEKYNGMERIEWIRRELDRVMDELRGPFGSGAAYTTLSCLRTANTRDCFPGSWRVLSADAVPNPASNQRGGSRVGLCVERVEDGPLLQLTFLDAGPSSVATSPTIGTPTVTNQVAAVPVVLNAAGDPVTVEMAVTAQSQVTAPASEDPLWTYAGRLEASGSLTVPNLPNGSRLWFRAQSRPTARGVAPKLPSPWVYAAAVNTLGITAPSGLAVTALTASTGLAAWTNGTLDLPVEVLLVSGAAPASWDSATMRLAVLPKGSDRLSLEGLYGPSATQTLAVRYLSPVGPPSAAATITFTTTAVTTAVPRPAGIALAIT